MAGIDSFWDRLFDSGLLTMDQVGRARTRYAQYGGGLDTAVIEVTALDSDELNVLLYGGIGGRWFTPASTEFWTFQTLKHWPDSPGHLSNVMEWFPVENWTADPFTNGGASSSSP